MSTADISFDSYTDEVIRNNRGKMFDLEFDSYSDVAFNVMNAGTLCEHFVSNHPKTPAFSFQAINSRGFDRGTAYLLSGLCTDIGYFLSEARRVFKDEPGYRCLVQHGDFKINNVIVTDTGRGRRARALPIDLDSLGEIHPDRFINSGPSPTVTYGPPELKAQYGLLAALYRRQMKLEKSAYVRDHSDADSISETQKPYRKKFEQDIRKYFESGEIRTNPGHDAGYIRAQFDVRVGTSWGLDAYDLGLTILEICSSFRVRGSKNDETDGASVRKLSKFSSTVGSGQQKKNISFENVDRSLNIFRIFFQEIKDLQNCFAHGRLVNCERRLAHLKNARLKNETSIVRGRLGAHKKQSAQQKFMSRNVPLPLIIAGRFIADPHNAHDFDPLLFEGTSQARDNHLRKRMVWAYPADYEFQIVSKKSGGVLSARRIADVVGDLVRVKENHGFFINRFLADPDPLNEFLTGNASFAWLFPLELLKSRKWKRTDSDQVFGGESFFAKRGIPIEEKVSRTEEYYVMNTCIKRKRTKDTTTSFRFPTNGILDWLTSFRRERSADFRAFQERLKEEVESEGEIFGGATYANASEDVEVDDDASLSLLVFANLLEYFMNHFGTSEYDAIKVEIFVDPPQLQLSMAKPAGLLASDPAHRTSPEQFTQRIEKVHEILAHEPADAEAYTPRGMTEKMLVKYRKNTARKSGGKRGTKKSDVIGEWEKKMFRYPTFAHPALVAALLDSQTTGKNLGLVQLASAASPALLSTLLSHSDDGIPEDEVQLVALQLRGERHKFSAIVGDAGGHVAGSDGAGGGASIDDAFDVGVQSSNLLQKLLGTPEIADIIFGGSDTIGSRTGYVEQHAFRPRAHVYIMVKGQEGEEAPIYRPGVVRTVYPGAGLFGDEPLYDVERKKSIQCIFKENKVADPEMRDALADPDTPDQLVAMNVPRCFLLYRFKRGEKVYVKPQGSFVWSQPGYVEGIRIVEGTPRYTVKMESQAYSLVDIGTFGLWPATVADDASHNDPALFSTPMNPYFALDTSLMRKVEALWTRAGHGDLWRAVNAFCGKGLGVAELDFDEGSANYVDARLLEIRLLQENGISDVWATLRRGARAVIDEEKLRGAVINEEGKPPVVETDMPLPVLELNDETTSMASSAEGGGRISSGALISQHVEMIGAGPNYEPGVEARRRSG